MKEDGGGSGRRRRVTVTLNERTRVSLAIATRRHEWGHLTEARQVVTPLSGGEGGTQRGPHRVCNNRDLG